MNEISPLNHNNPIHRLNGSHTPATPDAAAPARPGDSVEVSVTASLLARLAALPDVRSDLVNHVKSQIEDGSYETPEKLEAAIHALAEDLA